MLLVRWSIALVHPSMVLELESAKSHVAAPAQPFKRDDKTSGGESRGDDDDEDDKDDPT